MAISHRHRPLVYPDYINPLPADDIIKIGAVKQDLYDKNYEKIQGHINELDKYGLELVRDVDKKYFSQEMNKYMKAVNESVGKTDFSNMANLRSVLSTSRPLQNDQLILNSIKSSQELRNRQKTLSSLKPGERNPANEWYYMKDVYDWQNNNEVGAKLGSKEYTPFADPSEYISNIVKTLKPQIRTEVVSKGGYINSKEIEEVTDERLLQWMNQNLPAQYKQQIMIDAAYTTKDVDPAEMANYYFDTRLNQYNQIKKTLDQYAPYKDYLNEDDKEEYATLARRAKILEDTLSDPPQTKEAAYNAWINDHYNSYLTGQADLYAYRQEKKKMEADPFSLASFNSNLRRNEAYYREITLEKEKERLGLRDNNQGLFGEGKTVTTADGRKVEVKKLKNELDNAKLLNKSFKKFTNNLTTSKQFVPLDSKRLNENEAGLLKTALKDALYSYSSNPGSQVDKDNIPETIDLSKVQVRQNSDGTYVFKVNTGVDKPWSPFTGDIVYQVFQDKLDDALRNIQGLENTDFEYSVDSRFTRNEPVDETGAAVKSDLRRQSDKLDSTKLNNYYNSLRKNLEQ